MEENNQPNPNLRIIDFGQDKRVPALVRKEFVLYVDQWGFGELDQKDLGCPFETYRPDSGGIPCILLMDHENDKQIWVPLTKPMVDTIIEDMKKLQKMKVYPASLR